MQGTVCRRVFAFISAIAISSCSSIALAESEVLTAEAESTPVPEKPVKFVLTGGFTFGGDELVRLEYEGGDSDKIKAGNLIYFGAGVASRVGESPVMIQATINYHFDISLAENGDATFSRIPLEVIAFYTQEKFRFGAGLSYHLSPTLDIETDFSSSKAKFDDALGYVFQVDYMIDPKFAIGARTLVIDYEIQKFNTSFDGNYIGFVGTLLL